MTENPRQLLSERRAQLADILQGAVDSLDRYDCYLLKSNLKEEAINHRLAVYVEGAINSDSAFKQFGFSIDNEYNKFGMDAKSVPNTWDSANLPNRPRDRRLRPDIIVHHRGNEPGGINLLTVEVKKSSTVSNKARQYALWKSAAYRSSNLDYLFAAYVCLNTGKHWNKGRSLRELVLLPE